MLGIHVIEPVPPAIEPAVVKQMAVSVEAERLAGAFGASDDTVSTGTVVVAAVALLGAFAGLAYAVQGCRARGACPW